MKNSKLSRAVISLILCMSVVLMLPLTAFADGDSIVKLEDGASEFVFVPDSTDLFHDFKNLMPGDTVTQEIKIINNHKTPVDIYIRIEAIDVKYEDFLSHLELTLEWQGKTEDFFAPEESPATTLGHLKEKKLLGSFGVKSNGTIIATIHVPEDLDSKYMNNEGHIIWYFYAQESVIPTGDSSPVIPVACVFAVSAAVFFTLLVYNKRKKDSENTAAAN